MHDVAAPGLIQALVVGTREPVDQPDVPSLGQKRLLVDEAPKRQEAVDAAGVLVVAEDPSHLQHAPTSTSNRTCLAASYRGLNRDEDSRMRSICGSRLVAHNAKTY